MPGSNVGQQSASDGVKQLHRQKKSTCTLCARRRCSTTQRRIHTPTHAQELAPGDDGQNKVPQAGLRKWRAAEFGGSLELPTGKLDQTGTPSADMSTLLRALCADQARGVSAPAVTAAAEEARRQCRRQVLESLVRILRESYAFPPSHDGCEGWGPTNAVVDAEFAGVLSGLLPIGDAQGGESCQRGLRGVSVQAEAEQPLAVPNSAGWDSVSQHAAQNAARAWRETACRLVAREWAILDRAVGAVPAVYV